MGKASRGKAQRSHDRDRQWTGASGARTAQRMKADTLAKTRNNPIVRSMLATNINNGASP